VAGTFYRNVSIAICSTNERIFGVASEMKHFKMPDCDISGFEVFIAGGIKMVE